VRKGRRVEQKVFFKLKASIPILHTDSNKLYEIRYPAASSAGSVQLKKPSRWPKALVGSPCHGAAKLFIKVRGVFFPKKLVK